MSEAQKSLVKLFFICLAFLILSGCQGAGSTNFQTMLQNLSRSYAPLWELFTAAAYVLGFGLTLKALHNLKVYGEARTMTSSQSSIKTPLAYLLAATFLIFIPSGFSVINSTFFSTPNPLSYTGGNVGSFTESSIVAVIGAVQLIGLIAFIRGWLLIARAGEHSGQPGAVGKAITHIIGGAFAINVVQVKDVVWNTLGFGG